jgi:hypothetical protein
LILFIIVVGVAGYVAVHYAKKHSNPHPSPPHPPPPPPPPCVGCGCPKDNPSSPYAYLGCFADKAGARAFGTSAGTVQNIDDCYAKAKNAKVPGFGLQAYNPSTGKSECWYGDPMTAQRYGKSDICQSNSNGICMGGNWSNSVYAVK